MNCIIVDIIFQLNTLAIVSMHTCVYQPPPAHLLLAILALATGYTKSRLLLDGRCIVHLEPAEDALCGHNKTAGKQFSGNRNGSYDYTKTVAFYSPTLFKGRPQNQRCGS